MTSGEPRFQPVRRLQHRLSALARYDLRAFVRWLALCAGVGVAAGLAAAAFVAVVDELQFALLDRLVGVVLERPPGEGAPPPPGAPLLPEWLLPLLPMLGGLGVGLLAFRLGPRILGGGTEVVLHSYHQRDGRLAPRVAVGKWVASALTLGTGGSAGREGPMGLVGAGIGSATARLFRVAHRERRLLLLAGTGAAIGAVFRIPLGSAIFAIELLYRDGFEEEGIFPCLIASVSAFSVFSALEGAGHLFEVSDAAFGAVPFHAVPLYAVVGVAVAPYGYLFVASIERVPRALAAVRIPRWVQPAVGGLLLGLLGLYRHELLGIGYGWVQEVLEPRAAEASLALAGTYLLFAFGKTVATALTVGSGGSGGTFAPAVVAGGFVGGAVGQALGVLLPGLAPPPATFALVGMGAFLGGIAHTPLAAVIIVCELAGNYELLVPLMVAVGVSYVLQRRTTLYPAQVRNPAASPAHAREIHLDVLGTLRVHHLGHLRPAPDPIPASMPLADFVHEVAQRRDSLFPVADEQGRIVGMLTLRALRTVLDASHAWSAMAVVDAAAPLVGATPDDSLQRVLELLLATGTHEIPVLDARGRLLGLVGHEDVARLSLQESARRRTASDAGPP